MSTVGCGPGNINVFNSNSMHTRLPSDTKKVISDLIRYRGDAITIRYNSVQWQSGANDCGLFAIAFAAAICSGENPVTKVFDQAMMRLHLKDCFIKGRIDSFPERISKRMCTKKEPQQETLHVFCICRLPYMGEVMVQCEGCSIWYHPLCVDIPQKYLKQNCKEIYFCKDCSY